MGFLKDCRFWNYKKGNPEPVNLKYMIIQGEKDGVIT
jgi:hypothetical protein